MLTEAITRPSPPKRFGGGDKLLAISFRLRYNGKYKRITIRRQVKPGVGPRPHPMRMHDHPHSSITAPKHIINAPPSVFKRESLILCSVFAVFSGGVMEA